MSDYENVLDVPASSRLKPVPRECILSPERAADGSANRHQHPIRFTEPNRSTSTPPIRRGFFCLRLDKTGETPLIRDPR
jgi:hypothetical protein